MLALFFMTYSSPCKINLILNLLGRRSDGFHELETVMQPVAVRDLLSFERGGNGIKLTCSDSSLPVDSRNLVYKAASSFLEKTGITDGLRIHLEKKTPVAAGLGGGSSNAGVTLRALNQLFDQPLTPAQLSVLAAKLGSDIPFFLQDGPALGTGRGEIISPLKPFACLKDIAVILVHPGFGISTPWAYQQMSNFPEAQNGVPGRASRLIQQLQSGNVAGAAKEFYNSLEAPALKKYPLLGLFQDFFREQGAIATMMSGSGSATFALMTSKGCAEDTVECFKRAFGIEFWITVAPFCGNQTDDIC
jgi:4-diphosphocytidyl-2-C-methyl-D-erythritol kinase